jgi:hypothetical protein
MDQQNLALTNKNMALTPQMGVPMKISRNIFWKMQHVTIIRVVKISGLFVNIPCTLS